MVQLMLYLGIVALFFQKRGVIMPDTETTLLITTIVLGVALAVSVIFNIFFMLDMWYHIWCYVRRSHYNDCDSDSDDDDADQEKATSNEHLYSVTARSARRSSSIVMLKGDRADGL